MKAYPCAKINLGLYVTERRPDGYHNLQTVFYPIPLCDELTVDIHNGKSDQLCMEGIHVEGPLEENLVLRVANQLREEGFPIPPLKIELRKNIPSGAGLGGGSSDAAYMACMLNEMFRLRLSADGLEKRLTRLGADCPFFVRHQPVYATGIGDQFSPISLNLDGMWLLLVKPDDFISTREAYARVTPRKPLHSLTENILRPIEEWPALLENDFEASVFPNHPTVANIKRRLYEGGALYAAMSGSGSSVYGIFRQEPDSGLKRDLSAHFTFTHKLTSSLL